MSEKFVCATCGEEIDSDFVWKYMDNFIQFNFFDSPEENRFCSIECAARATMLEDVIL